MPTAISSANLVVVSAPAVTEGWNTRAARETMAGPRRMMTPLVSPAVALLAKARTATATAEPSTAPTSANWNLPVAVMRPRTAPNRQAIVATGKADAGVTAVTVHGQFHSVGNGVA